MLPVIRRIVEFDRARKKHWSATHAGIPPGEMTPQEAAGLLGVSPDAVYDVINAGKVETMLYDLGGSVPTKRVTVRGLIHYVLTRATGAREEEMGGSIERLLLLLNDAVLKVIHARIEIILARRAGREPAADALRRYGSHAAAPLPVQPPVAMLRVADVQAELFAAQPGTGN